MDFKVTKQDIIFFPFTSDQMYGELGLEYMKYVELLGAANVIDATEEPPKSYPGRLILFGHGTRKLSKIHKLGGDSGIQTAPDVAAMIAKIGFPKDPKNEIVVWSCHSGVVPGFAQLLTLYLIHQGYFGKKIWGCRLYTGVMSDDLKLRVSDGTDSRVATDDDVAYFIGAGPPRQA